VSGSSTSVTAPISDSRWRVSYAEPVRERGERRAEQRRDEHQDQHAADAARVVRAERPREQHDQQRLEQDLDHGLGDAPEVQRTPPHRRGEHPGPSRRR
jgi:hypothetical protein